MGQSQRSNICVIESQKKKRKTGLQKRMFEEAIAENSSNLTKDINLQIQETQ